MSIVSTKIPFKGTGKEYIGDDISEIASAVKVSFLGVNFCSLNVVFVQQFLVNLDGMMIADCHTAMLCSTKVQNCEENSGS